MKKRILLVLLMAPGFAGAGKLSKVTDGNGHVAFTNSCSPLNEKVCITNSFKELNNARIVRQTDMGGLALISHKWECRNGVSKLLLGQRTDGTGFVKLMDRDDMGFIETYIKHDGLNKVWLWDDGEYTYNLHLYPNNRLHYIHFLMHGDLNKQASEMVYTCTKNASLLRKRR